MGQINLSGEVSNIKKYPTKNGGTLCLFTIKQYKHGWIDCKTFDTNIVNILEEGLYIDVETCTIQKDTTINPMTNEKRYFTSVVVNSISIIDAPIGKTSKNSVQDKRNVNAKANENVEITVDEIENIFGDIKQEFEQDREKMLQEATEQAKREQEELDSDEIFDFGDL